MDTKNCKENELKILTVNDLGTFESIIQNTAAEIREIAQELRLLIADVLPGVTEVAWEKQRIIGYGVGPKKMSEHFCYIAPQKNHVNLGFYYGADLDDPFRLLEGTGKKLRHIKIHSKAEIAKPELLQLLQQASKYLPKLK